MQVFGNLQQYEEVLRGMNLENLDLLIGKGVQNT